MKGQNRNLIFVIIGIVLLVVVLSGDLLQVVGDDRIEIPCDNVSECEQWASDNGASQSQIEEADIQCTSEGVCTTRAQEGEI